MVESSTNNHSGSSSSSNSSVRSPYAGAATPPTEKPLEPASSIPPETLDRQISTEAHVNQLYDGYADYHLDPSLTDGSRPVSRDPGVASVDGTGHQTPNLSRLRSRVSVLSRTHTQGRAFSHPLTHQKTAPDVLVDFDGKDDPYRPINWSFKKKAYTTLIYGLTTAGATWGSSIFAVVTDDLSVVFQQNRIVCILGVSLYLFGFGTGPMLWAPLSELYGRRAAVFIPYFIGAVFSFGSATAKDFQTLMITRFFTGFFSSAPVTNTGGVLGDLWLPSQRGTALAGYSIAVAGGPLLAPVVGGAIVVTGVSWRWTEYVTGLFQMAVLVVGVLTAEESYPPVLLVRKAQRLRHESGNWALHAKHEEWDVSLVELANKYLVRPFVILFTPITAAMATYASFVYGIVYLLFEAFPIAYQEVRGWNPLVGGLPYIAVLLGVFSGAFINSLNTKFYASRVKANNNRPVPEARLPPMMVGSVIFPAGAFIFGWTTQPDVHWIGSVIGAFLIGTGFVVIFQSALNYLIDTFQMYAASAVAGNTALRSLFAGVFPLFAPFMFHGLGVPWAASVIGFVAILLIPIPFLFYIFGFRIRRAGQWSRPSTE